MRFFDSIKIDFAKTKPSQIPFGENQPLICKPGGQRSNHSTTTAVILIDQRQSFM